MEVMMQSSQLSVSAAISAGLLPADIQDHQMHMPGIPAYVFSFNYDFSTLPPVHVNAHAGSSPPSRAITHDPPLASLLFSHVQQHHPIYKLIRNATSSHDVFGVTSNGTINPHHSLLSSNAIPIHPSHDLPPSPYRLHLLRLLIPLILPIAHHPPPPEHDSPSSSAVLVTAAAEHHSPRLPPTPPPNPPPPPPKPPTLCPTTVSLINVAAKTLNPALDNLLTILPPPLLPTSTAATSHSTDSPTSPHDVPPHPPPPASTKPPNRVEIMARTLDYIMHLKGRLGQLDGRLRG
ncbi:hypothetical protein BC829DRAFT_448299 [Chytridium lagenaria]|nr:hypothetical protein BC829DRAFT_448299 [Chytridium lagenaria]